VHKLTILLDQNIPYPVTTWLREKLVDSEVVHTREVGLKQAEDLIIYNWVQDKKGIVVTFDEDFAKQYYFPNRHHSTTGRANLFDTGY